MGDAEPPTEPDPFEDLTLDEDFVRGAEVVEESADARLARMARIEAEHRRLAETREVQQASLDRSLRRKARKARRARRLGGQWQRFTVIVVMMAVFAGLIVWNARSSKGTSALGDSPFADATSGSVSQADRPPPGVGEADQPLGVPTPPPLESSSYHFIATQDGTEEPVAYDPCRAIHVVVNGRTEIAGGDQLLQQALDDVGRATGLVFVIDPPTDEAPSEHRAAYQPDRYPGRWAPVLVAWSDPVETPELAGDVAGLAGSGWASVDRGSVYVSGDVTLDGPDLAEIAAIDGPTRVRSVIEHELGHLVGLDHVDDATQLMYPSIGTATGFADGDLTGLYRLGQGECFPTV